MKERSKTFLLALGIGTMVTLGVIGSTTGTIAWYAYSRTVRISYVGTSVKKSEILSVGIVDDNHFIHDDHLVDYGLTRTTVDDTEGGLPVQHSIVWTNATTGIATEAIREYLWNSPYAVDKLSPCSTLTRALGSNDDLTLYRSPDYGDEVVTKATKLDDYVRIPFAFKVIDNDDQLVAGQDIWLTDVSVQVADGVNIHESVRVFVQNDTQKLLFKPADNSDNDSGTTIIGGQLDLDGDGTYDFNKQSGNEYIYGAYSDRSSITWSNTPYGIPYEDAEPINVNGTPYTTEQSTFYAKHNEYACLPNYSRSNFGVADYYTFHKIKPSKNGSGDYYAGETGIAMTTTRAESKIGYATFTIFLEGWDYSVVDKEDGHAFNLGLQFEVNRI